MMCSILIILNLYFIRSINAWLADTFFYLTASEYYTRAFVYISYFDAARWRADTEITQKSTDSILFSSMVTPVKLTTLVVTFLKQN